MVYKNILLYTSSLHSHFLSYKMCNTKFNIIIIYNKYTVNVETKHYVKKIIKI